MKKILIIEDEPGISTFLKEGLEEEGYQIEIAEEGESGLKKALSGKFDLILMDWMLPGLSGLEITNKLRETDVVTPIIFLTAKDTVQDTILGLRSGANDYLKKPFSFEELLERIHVQFRKPHAKTTVFRHGPLTIDDAKHEVKWFDKTVSLTQKEYDLLLFLIKNKNRICTRKEILKKVWDIHFEYSSGVIDVYINSLRKKLPAENNGELIETVRGIGYIIKDKEDESGI
ncbi:response regulator transcription factor [Candidatus Sulfidibacterium hydrothermale]|uniref:response regulator transcription factor n=1 Tax=Candidatus Sulfidibacterium hydrothermale TaxID=2875962 RepID=UPI001F0A704E|nr:response regulator transcription factor [Candidatus Sulfidibacterium hydrothermale]UBM63091.1 response regulator transcription factor [Candidatus Sulfidibacterium hydrothermale]